MPRNVLSRSAFKELPRYKCLLEAVKQFPDLNPATSEAYFNLLSAVDMLTAAEDRHLSEYNLSQGRFAVLMALWHNLKERPWLTPAELADEAGVTRATMTGLLEALERDGWITRKSNPQDRRMLRVSLTAQGKRRLEKLLPEYFRFVSRMLAPLNATEKKNLVTLLGELRQVHPQNAVLNGNHRF